MLLRMPGMLQKREQKKAGDAIEKGAKKVGEETKEVFRNDKKKDTL